MTNQLITQPTQTNLPTQRKRIEISFLEERLSPEFDFQGFKFNRKVTVAELNEALEEIKSSLIPASDKEIAGELLKLRSLTKTRNEGKNDIRIMMESYAEKFREYPRDVVLEVLRMAPGRYKFFPSWAELKEELDWRSGYAKEAVAAIEGKIMSRRLQELK